VHYAARLIAVSSRAARASSGLRWSLNSITRFSVVAGGEGLDGFADLDDGWEDAAVDGRLFAAALQVLDDAGGFRPSDEREARR
jgi:hypothetical protein